MLVVPEPPQGKSGNETKANDNEPSAESYAWADAFIADVIASVEAREVALAAA